MRNSISCTIVAGLAMLAIELSDLECVRRSAGALRALPGRARTNEDTRDREHILICPMQMISGTRSYGSSRFVLRLFASRSQCSW